MPNFFALNLPHSYTDHVLAAPESMHGLSSALIYGNYSDKSSIQTLPTGDTQSIDLHSLTSEDKEEYDPLNLYKD